MITQPIEIIGIILFITAVIVGQEWVIKAIKNRIKS